MSLFGLAKLPLVCNFVSASCNHDVNLSGDQIVPARLTAVLWNVKIESSKNHLAAEVQVMGKIPSRKLSNTGRKIASRKFPNVKRNISSGGTMKSLSPGSTSTSDAADQVAAEPEPLIRLTDEQSREQVIAELKRRTARTMIHTLLDAIQFILQEQGEPQSCSCISSQLMELKLWRASEADVRDGLTKDIKRLQAESRFIQVDDDSFALRE